MRSLVEDFSSVATTCARSVRYFRTPINHFRAHFQTIPVKAKRQTDAQHRRFVGLDQSHFGPCSREDSSDESALQLMRSKASVAEVLRHRLMSCGLITTKSPDRWRDRLISELDDIITELEDKSALCKSLYEEPYRYDMLRSLISPCPVCYRKNAKRKLLLALQKVLVQSVDNLPEDGGISVEETANDSKDLPFTDAPKTRKTRSTTEVPLLTTTIQPESGTELTNDSKLQSAWGQRHAKHSTEVTTTEYSVTAKRHGEHSVGHLYNGQTIGSVQEFLQHYMNTVYGGNPGDEERKQFFLEQLCRSASNGKIVLQCPHLDGERKSRSFPRVPAEETLSFRNTAEGSDTARDNKTPILPVSTNIDASPPNGFQGHRRWPFQNRQRWGHEI
ncbi:uncharacterized protein LOC118456523 isoform X2 [Anopheles albimanus]|uniref:uncharacterized protein LOC118456523 isoform X2 n=1 Tax=Anopheles albimanus TaxID=7167 RepID=UPI00163E5BCD|nr:uncharacterized protein LOC118456523 isoform X2 [Anopheles albimanus]